MSRPLAPLLAQIDELLREMDMVKMQEHLSVELKLSVKGPTKAALIALGWMPPPKQAQEPVVSLGLAPPPKQAQEPVVEPLAAGSDESSHEAGSSCGCLNVGPAGPTPAFHVETVEELLGQLVGACSSVGFWDALPTSYPYGAGTFRDDVAGHLVEAATTEYRRLTEPAPPGHEDHPRIKGGVDPACVEAVELTRRRPVLNVTVMPGMPRQYEGGWIR